MIAFDPKNPYPLLAAGTATYAEEQAHSALVDEWLGMRGAKIEANLREAEPSMLQASNPQQRWIGLPLQAMQTPYTELRSILCKLAPQAGQTVVDLGAAYGRMGLVLAAHFPEVSFVGYELVPQRVAEGHRLWERAGAQGAHRRLKQGDLLSCAPISAEIYFLYDFGSRQAIDKTLNDLRQIARHRAITVVGRGRATRDAIEQREPWLSQIHKPEHLDRSSIYKS